MIENNSKKLTRSVERRNFFRVTDFVTVNIKKISKFQLKETLREFEYLRCYCDSNVLSQAPLSLKYSTLKPSIESFDRQILYCDDILEDSEGLTHCLREVSLSENGIRFGSDLALKKNQYMLIEMKFSYGNGKILAIAQVVSSKKIKDPDSAENDYKISAKFTHMDQRDKEKIYKRIQKIQIKNR